MPPKLTETSRSPAPVLPLLRGFEPGALTPISRARRAVTSRTAAAMRDQVVDGKVMLERLEILRGFTDLLDVGLGAPLGGERGGEGVQRPPHFDGTVDAEMFARTYADVFTGDHTWRTLNAPTGTTFGWADDSTYVRRPPYLDGTTREPGPMGDIIGARVLVKLGDSVTTDHVSPAGAIPAGTPAGPYLTALGVPRSSLNTYASRRGNHEVGMRGCFANGSRSTSDTAGSCSTSSAPYCAATGASTGLQRIRRRVLDQGTLNCGHPHHRWRPPPADLRSGPAPGHRARRAQ
jgi:hypothetical protein